MAWVPIPKSAVLHPGMYWCSSKALGLESTLHHRGRWLGFLGARTNLLFWVLAFAHWSLMPAYSLGGSVVGWVRLLNGAGLV